MSDAYVLDASIAFSWVFPSQASVEADALLENVKAGMALVVPPLWFLEVANGLLAAQRRRLLTTSERTDALRQLSALTVTVDDEGVRAAFGRMSTLAEEHGLSVYDAVYLELAMRRALPLASRDKAILAAAARNGVKVFECPQPR